jgi:15-hydroxyprostaglandin dehydrogenase (NAD)
MGAKKRVALITGGASGMGLAVAERLSNIGWNIAVVDLNEQQSEPVLALLGPSAIFVRANVVHYDELLVAFQKTRDHFGSIDFVFANAGIIGRVEFYDVAMQWPPKAPMLAVQDICLTGVIYTSYLAMHFMRQNHKGEGVIVMTASGG